MGQVPEVSRRNVSVQRRTVQEAEFEAGVTDPPGAAFSDWRLPNGVKGLCEVDFCGSKILCVESSSSLASNYVNLSHLQGSYLIDSHRVRLDQGEDKKEGLRIGLKYNKDLKDLLLSSRSNPNARAGMSGGKTCILVHFELAFFTMHRHSHNQNDAMRRVLLQLMIEMPVLIDLQAILQRANSMYHFYLQDSMSGDSLIKSMMSLSMSSEAQVLLINDEVEKTLGPLRKSCLDFGIILPAAESLSWEQKCHALIARIQQRVLSGDGLNSRLLEPGLEGMIPDPPTLHSLSNPIMLPPKSAPFQANNLNSASNNDTPNDLSSFKYANDYDLSFDLSSFNAANDNDISFDLSSINAANDANDLSSEDLVYS